MFVATLACPIVKATEGGRTSELVQARALGYEQANVQCASFLLDLTIHLFMFHFQHKVAYFTEFHSTKNQGSIHQFQLKAQRHAATLTRSKNCFASPSHAHLPSSSGASLYATFKSMLHPVFSAEIA